METDENEEKLLRSVALQNANSILLARQQAEMELRALKDRLAADLQAMTHLHHVGSHCVQPGKHFDECLGEIVEAAIAVTGANKGNMHLLDASSGALKLAAHRGFDKPFLSFFTTVRDEAAACGAAMQRSERVVEEDITQSRIFAGTPALDVLLDAGVRAVQSTPLLSSEGHLLGMISTHFSEPRHLSERELRLMDLLARQAADFVERKQAEEALRQSEERFRGLFNSAPVAVFVCDQSGVIQAYNPRAAELWGREPVCGDPAERNCGSMMLRLPNGDVLPHSQSPIVDVLRTGESRQSVEVIIERPNGSRVTVLVNFAPLKNLQGEVTGAVTSFIDITERKRMEESLKEADRRKDEFLATLAHELRNPLAPIRNSLHILRMAGRDGYSLERVHQMMERQVNLMVRLVDDLMEVSRITRGSIEIRKERVELTAVMQSAIETARPLIESRRHKLAVLFPPEPVILEADPMRLAQIFANLLNNAAKYTPDNGQIWLRAERAAPSIVVSIRDTGIGIAPEMLPQIFEMFTRVGNAEQPGLGIGLTLALRLLEMHGGSVEVRSEGLGKGSEFIVRLPVVKDEGGRLKDDSKPFASSRARMPLRVLVVDDNHDAADSLGMLLRFEGADVHVVYDGASALRALETYQPRIVLLDLGMPDMDGFEVARRIRKNPEFKDLTIVALTGWGQEHDRKLSREAGFDHHLIKPADLNTLHALLASVEKTAA